MTLFDNPLKKKKKLTKELMDNVTTYYSKIENNYGTKLKEHFFFYFLTCPHKKGEGDLD
jgi:hypothetical protein